MLLKKTIQFRNVCASKQSRLQFNIVLFLFFFFFLPSVKWISSMKIKNGYKSVFINLQVYICQLKKLYSLFWETRWDHNVKLVTTMWSLVVRFWESLSCRSCCGGLQMFCWTAWDWDCFKLQIFPWFLGICFYKCDLLRKVVAVVKEKKGISLIWCLKGDRKCFLSQATYCS